MRITGSRVKSVVSFLFGLVAAFQTPQAVAAPLLDLSRTSIVYGHIPPQVDIVQALFVTNIGDVPLHLTGFALGGVNAADYRVGGTCAVPSVLSPGDRCRVDVIANVQITNGTGNSSATLTAQTDAAPAPNVVLNAQPVPGLFRGVSATPPWIDFGYQAMGAAAPSQVITMTNPESAAYGTRLNSVALVGPAAADFTLTSDCTVGNQYTGDASCNTTIGFTPSASGPRSAEIEFQLEPRGTSPGFDTVRFSVTGFGGAAAPVTVVEYYNQVLDHYFITWIAAEQANLDAGNTPTRWNRTGYSFRTYTSAQVDTSPVCRYYLPPASGDSHFFGRGTAECNATGAAHPAFILEDPRFMDMFLPVAGACPAGTTPIYRVFSNRADANHLYRTERRGRPQMAPHGWLAEGDGPDLVVMCAP